MLATIRQSIDNFHMDQRATDILNLLSKFYDQWSRFKDSLNKDSLNKVSDIESLKQESQYHLLDSNRESIVQLNRYILQRYFF